MEGCMHAALRQSPCSPRRHRDNVLGMCYAPCLGGEREFHWGHGRHPVGAGFPTDVKREPRLEQARKVFPAAPEGTSADCRRRDTAPAPIRRTKRALSKPGSHSKAFPLKPKKMYPETSKGPLPPQYGRYLSYRKRWTSRVIRVRDQVSFSCCVTGPPPKESHPREGKPTQIQTRGGGKGGTRNRTCSCGYPLPNTRSPNGYWPGCPLLLRTAHGVAELRCKVWQYVLLAHAFPPSLSMGKGRWDVS